MFRGMLFKGEFANNKECTPPPPTHWYYDISSPLRSSIVTKYLIFIVII